VFLRRSVALLGSAVAASAAVATFTLLPVATASATTSGAVSTTPVKNTYGANGTVYSMVKSGNVIYIAGKFTNVNNPAAPVATAVAAGSIAALDATTGRPIAGFSASVNGTVYKLSLSPDGSTLYFGGIFTSVDGAVRKNLGAVSTVDGSVTPWAPKATVAVRTVLATSDKVIVGGDFTYLNGLPVNRLGAVDTLTGATVWADSATCRVQALALSTDGTQVYAGGYAQYWNGYYQPGIVKINLTDGSLDHSFNANYQPNDAVCETVHHHAGNNPWQIEVNSTYNALIVSIGGRGNYLDALDASRGRTYWRDGADGDFQTATVLGSYIYAGGHFNVHISDQCRSTNKPTHIVRLNLQNGCADASWTAYATPGDGGGHFYGVWVLMTDGTNLYAGGAFLRINTVTDGVAKVQKTPGFAIFPALS
jgi:hypothetical protein